MVIPMEFEYDQFQRDAICALRRGDHVLVVAPTSSGKTCIAEHLLKQDVSGVIYTTPTKALCNQKFLDFQKYEVGLLTGDRAINEDAIHLVVTTEILLKLLVQNDDRIGEISHFVFDEFHFLGDKSRGHVWEECILKCPPNTRMLFLSATIPNSQEICSWLQRCTQQHVALVVETKRPVPLEQCIFQRDGSFSPVNTRTYEEKQGRRRSDWIQLCYNLKRCNLMPAIIFIFNRWECHLSAEAAASVDWLTKAESSCVLRELPVVMDEGLRFVLLRGVGVHHSGLTPPVREAIESLTQKGILRVVFATETLAIGLNMPTRTVVLSTLNKPADERLLEGRLERQTKRLLTAAEFTQLTGRAGRRGFDVVGTVIFPWWIPAIDLDRLLDADLPHVQSQLKINTRTVLHHDEDILARSFLTYPQMVVRSKEEERLWGEQKDHIELYELCLHTPLYKVKKRVVRKAAYALTSNGYKAITKVPKNYLALADLNQKLISQNKFVLPEKTLWYLENRFRIHALMASKPGSPPENVAEIYKRKCLWDQFLVRERELWRTYETNLHQNKFFIGSQKIQAARVFYAVDPIDAIDFLVSGGLQTNTITEIIKYFSELLQSKCDSTLLSECLEKGPTLVAQENLVFEGDLISTLIRIHNLIHEFQEACVILFGEKPHILEELDTRLKIDSFL